MLEELTVLSAEVLTGLLEAINLIKLSLLLCKSLTDNLTSLLVCLVADALSVCTSVCNKLICALLSNNEDLRNLVLGCSDSGCVRLLNRRNACVLLKVCNLSLCCSELLLSAGQTALKVSDLLKHCINLRRELLKKCVNFLWIVAGLSRRECLLLDVCWCDCHLCSLSVCE